MYLDKQLAITSALQVVFRGLKSQGFLWEMEQASSSRHVFKSHVVAVKAPSGEEFLMFFHTLQKSDFDSKIFYAIDFGVKKVQGVNHIAQFEVIAKAHAAIVRQIALEQKFNQTGPLAIRKAFSEGSAKIVEISLVTIEQ